MILEFCRFTADKMDMETLKNIAVVTLIANVKGENEEGSHRAREIVGRGAPAE